MMEFHFIFMFNHYVFRVCRTKITHVDLHHVLYKKQIRLSIKTVSRIDYKHKSII